MHSALMKLFSYLLLPANKRYAKRIRDSLTSYPDPRHSNVLFKISETEPNLGISETKPNLGCGFLLPVYHLVVPSYDIIMT